MITIVGGTYDEVCFEPHWKERFGSGLRACWVMDKLNTSGHQIRFSTFADSATTAFLEMLSPKPFAQLQTIPINSSVKFYYDHPLITPKIFPRPDTIDRAKNNLFADGENILCYGFLEGSASVKGRKVVYDPQSPVMPIPFSKTGSEAEELVYVINYREASLLSGEKAIQEIKDYFFKYEKAKALVIKMGPKGALLALSDGSEIHIPVYKTSNVWPIGSGDVFAAVFSFHWFNNQDLEYAARQASWQTAAYCNSKDFQFCNIDSNIDIRQLDIEQYPQGQVYLAGPFFTYSERWLVNEIRRSLLDMNLKVFSPWHDVGHGIANEVVPKDIAALDNSSIVFAVLDGLDSGTLFEIGYAVKQGIPVIGYVENESTESIKMLEGTGCILEKDLTTAVYKCFWKLSENE